MKVDLYSGTKKKEGVTYGSSTYWSLRADGYSLTSYSKKDVQSAGLSTSSRPPSTPSSNTSGSTSGAKIVPLSSARVGDLRKVSSSGREYYYTQDDIDKRDNTGAYAPAQQQLSAEKIAEIEATGASIGWSAQQIQWAKDAALAALNGSTPPAGTPPPTTPPPSTTTPPPPATNTGGGSTTQNGMTMEQAIANARAQGQQLGWTEQQIQWSIDSVKASYGQGQAPDPADNPQNTTGEQPTTTTGEEPTTTGVADFSGLENSEAYKKLSKDDQEAVRAVFSAIANNDQVQATRLTEAFKASSKINDPYFAQKMRLAIDAIERGYVAIDKQADYELEQITNRRKDLHEELLAKKDFMTLDQATKMREIDRNYGIQLEVLQDNMAATGFSSSSRRIKKEGLLNEATGDMRESSNRGFAYQVAQDERQDSRSARDTAAEIARLKELTDKGKLDFLRQAEEKVGSDNLPSLSGAPDALGDIYGNIPEEKLKNTISAATSFVF